MQAIYEFFRPTVPKLILVAQWAISILLLAVGGRLAGWHQLMVVLWPLLFFYCLACILVFWSQRVERVASGRLLALLAILTVAVDQMGKGIASALLDPDATLPIVEGWLHLTNVRNVGGSWLTPVWIKPVLIIVAVLVLPLSIIVYRYYISSKRKSLWADLGFLGIFAGYTSWLCDVSLRGYVIDFILIPGVVAADLKDLFLSVGGACVVIEVLDNPGISRRWAGLKAELGSTRRLVVDVAAFAAGEWRACQNTVKERFKSLLGNN